MTTWPLLPNWRDQFQVTYTFNTEIITSRRGYEQRRALMQTPRKSYQFATTALGERFRRVTRVLGSQIGFQIAYPDPTQYLRVAADVSAGSLVMPLLTTAGWLQLDATVALVDKDRCETLAVDHASSSGTRYALTLKTPVLTNWKAGSRLFRTLRSRIAAEVDTEQAVRGMIDGQVTVNVDPGLEPDPDPPPASVMWNGREVFARRSNWREAQTLNWVRVVEAVDFNRGRVSTYLPTPFTPEIRSAAHLMRTSAEIAQVVDFFRRQRGRQGEFYVPTDEADIVPTADLVGGHVLIVPGRDVFDAAATDTSRRAISIRKVNGDHVYVGVRALTLVGGNTYIATVDALPALPLSQLEVISWMPIRRMGSDNVTVVYTTDSVAELTFNYVTIAYPDPVTA